jgi:hypothetical protein
MNVVREFPLGIPSKGHQPHRPRVPAGQAAEFPLDERALASRVRARRRWIIQTALFLFGTAVLLVLVVVWRRDSVNVAALLLHLEEPVAALQARTDELGMLPAAIPEPHQDRIASYAGDAERFYAAQTSDPVIVGVSRPIRLMLGEDGRAVILFERGQLRIEWMPTSRFIAAMEAQLEAMRALDEQRRPPQLP